MLLNFLVFHTSWGISSRLAAFLLLNGFRTLSSFSYINCRSLLSNWRVIISWTGSSVTPGGFPSRFLKCSFCVWIFLLSWQFLVLLSMCFSFYSLHLLFAMPITIFYLLPNLWFYLFDLQCILIFLFSIFQFSLGFLKFLHIGVCWVSIIKLRWLLMLPRFSLTSFDSHETLHLALDLVGMY